MSNLVSNKDNKEMKNNSLNKDNQSNSITQVNLLILIPSPRKIRLFEEKKEALNQFYDIFVVKNDLNELRAYNKGRQFFLDHTEYSHLAILPDDLLLEPEDVQLLIEDLEKYNYPVLSGICNFLLSSKKFYNMMSCIEQRKYGASDIMRKTGKYDYHTIMTRKEYEELLNNKGEKIIRVCHSAFPFTIIRRDVVEKIEFGHNSMGVDVVFSQSCLQRNIPMYTDLRVETLHLKDAEENGEMRNIIELVVAENLYTKVNTNRLKLPNPEEIFLPKQVK